MDPLTVSFHLLFFCPNKRAQRRVELGSWSAAFLPVINGDLLHRGRDVTAMAQFYINKITSIKTTARCCHGNCWKYQWELWNVQQKFLPCLWPPDVILMPLSGAAGFQLHSYLSSLQTRCGLILPARIYTSHPHAHTHKPSSCLSMRKAHICAYAMFFRQYIWLVKLQCLSYWV